MNIWYINVTCDDNFVFSFPRLLLNKSKCTKNTVIYDPTYDTRDITRSRNHVINHCRKLELAYETNFKNRTKRGTNDDIERFINEFFNLPGIDSETIENPDRLDRRDDPFTVFLYKPILRNLSQQFSRPIPTLIRSKPFL